MIGAQTTFWGWPADPGHDAQRGKCLGANGKLLPPRWNVRPSRSW